MIRRFALPLVLVPMLASAAVVQAPVVKNSAGQPIEAQPVITVDTSGAYVAGGGGGGGSTTVTATSAAPTYAQGSTTNPLSSDLSGNLRVVVAGGSSSLAAQANAAAQTSSEGATTDPLSMTLARDLRVVAKQSGTWNVSVSNNTDPATATNQASTNTKLDTLHTDMTAPTPAGENLLGYVSIPLVVGSDTITLTSATTTWSAGMVMGSSTTAGSSKIMQLQVCRNTLGSAAQVRRIREKTSASDLGFSGQQVIVSFFKTLPTLQVGDRAAVPATGVTNEADWLGDVPLTFSKRFSNGEKGVSIPFEFNVSCQSGQNYIYAVVTAGTSFAPTAGSLTLTLVTESEGK